MCSCRPSDCGFAEPLLTFARRSARSPHSSSYTSHRAANWARPGQRDLPVSRLLATLRAERHRAACRSDARKANGAARPAALQTPPNAHPRASSPSLPVVHPPALAPPLGASCRPCAPRGPDPRAPTQHGRAVVPRVRRDDARCAAHLRGLQAGHAAPDHAAAARV